MTIAFLAALLTLNVALRAWPPHRRGDGPLTAVDCAFLRGGTTAAVLTALAILHVRDPGAHDEDSGTHSPAADDEVPGAHDDYAGADDEPGARDESPAADDEYPGGREEYPGGRGEEAPSAPGAVAAAPDADPRTGGEEPLERVVADAGDPPTGVWGISQGRQVRAAAAHVRERLVADGLLAPTGHWAIARCALLAVPVVAALGSVDQLLDLTAVVTSAVAVVLAAMLWLAPRRTIAGWRVLRAERRRYEQVTLAQPDAHDDPAAVGMLVALQGSPALEMVLARSTPTPPPTPAAAPPDALPYAVPSSPPRSAVEAGPPLAIAPSDPPPSAVEAGRPPDALPYAVPSGPPPSAVEAAPPPAAAPSDPPPSAAPRAMESVGTAGTGGRDDAGKPDTEEDTVHPAEKALVDSPLKPRRLML